MAKQLSGSKKNRAIIEKEMRLALLSVWHTFDINKRGLLFGKICAELSLNGSPEDFDFINALLEEEKKISKVYIAD